MRPSERRPILDVLADFKDTKELDVCVVVFIRIPQGLMENRV